VTDISETDCFVECRIPWSIPKYRLVHLQLERHCQDAAHAPLALRQHRKVLAVVLRVGERQHGTGTPGGYGLRLIIEPALAARHAEAASALALAN
jgi:hypothetical protein